MLVPPNTDQKGGRVKSLEPSVVEPAGGYAFLMSKLEGGGLLFLEGSVRVRVLHVLATG